jgi:hypothetical protein
VRAVPALSVTGGTNPGASGDGPSAAPGAGPSPSERWLLASDPILEGIAHALSNRVGTVAMAAEALAEVGGSLGATLAAEAERLEALLRVLRLVPRSPEARPEITHPATLAADALALVRIHARWRDLPVMLDGLEPLPLVDVRGTAVTHALVLALGAALDVAGAATLVGHSGERHGPVVVLDVAPRFEGAPGAGAADELRVAVAAAGSLLRAAAGETLTLHGESGLTLRMRLPALGA